MPVEVQARACPICGRDNRDQPPHAYSRAPWELKLCRGCGLLYLENPPHYASLEDEFAWEKTYREEDRERRRRRPVSYRVSRGLQAIPRRLFRRDKLTSWVRRYMAPGPVLDVGCSYGHMLARLPAEYVPFGIEVSRDLARIANAAFAPRGGRVEPGDALSALPRWPAEFFSGVIMTSYLEHEVNPRRALELARQVMRPGARLIVKVPNFSSWNRCARGARWCGFRYPDHVNYFTPALLERLLELGGMRVVRFGLINRFPTSDNMWLVAEKS